MEEVNPKSNKIIENEKPCRKNSNRGKSIVRERDTDSEEEFIKRQLENELQSSEDEIEEQVVNRSSTRSKSR